MSLLELIRLDGKRALVTGAGEGIGKGCAIELAHAGADLILNDRPGSESLQKTAEEIRNLGCECQTVEADVFTVEGGEQLIKAVGEVDILISNPAYGKRYNFLDLPFDELDKIIDRTFKSGFRISQGIARAMAARGQGGKILFISSVQAEMPIARSSAYGPAKAAINHLTESMAVELCDYRINVNAIEPGWIDTPQERRTFPDEVIEKEGRALPWGRIGNPEDIGRAAAFLVSPAADYITGSILPVDGGHRFKDFRLGTLTLEKDPA